MNSTDVPQHKRRIHLRQISCVAYQRDDGLIEIEGTLVDTKPFPLTLPERGHLEPDEKIHEMTLRLTIDQEFMILDAVAATLHSPYRVCGAINPAYAQLIGTRIGPGFVLHVKRTFRGVEGCSHMTELLPAMATTAFQAVWSDAAKFNPENLDTGYSPLNGCHALRLDGEVVKLYFPNKYQLPAAKADEE